MVLRDCFETNPFHRHRKSCLKETARLQLAAALAAVFTCTKQLYSQNKSLSTTLRSHPPLYCIKIFFSERLKRKKGEKGD